ncbi:uncharacterized protein SCHCODRAFT_02329642 [Schizophyllum commune H4-8]|uniref:uncharacterized protein n=1 Tax=Schizophyllum commune (strain H4-8 / FGSC 9210) TaxID=578458 RepID=UPI00215E8093|nr:uncharacterized protein SCHCODRAFT_02179528 [Schizophyllum commune H4-8]XP_050199811.1 uncharacterized protein SCHCODRAFT_02329642 [Schizophyllum commune H4-8]KAI5836587.1 hypothetical protein SCHCODRAFT_02179528 [Schizophyllum commune H4-8]KAI5891811.1 hypothetical protein SCHCODRAFT_02329642 [Schizophyllum commune H4-8]
MKMHRLELEVIRESVLGGGHHWEHEREGQNTHQRSSLVGRNSIYSTLSATSET